MHRHFPFAVLVLLILAATVPFLDKAFHIDDNEYLLIARHILKDPFRPYDFTWVTGGEEVYEFDLTRSPPFFEYVLALGLLVFGDAEVPLHMLMSLFTTVVAVSMYALGLRFSPRPLLATTIVVLNPLFVPGQNLMLDVPMLALGLAGLACHVRGTDGSNLRLVLVGGFLVGLAIATKYPAAILVLLMTFYSWQKRSRLVWVSLVVAGLPLAAWSLQNILVHGQLHVLSQFPRGLGSSWRLAIQRVPPSVMILGSGFFPLLAAPRLINSLRWHFAILATSISGSVIYRSFQPTDQPMPWTYVAHHLVFLAGGMFLVITLVASQWLAARRDEPSANSDRHFLLVWFFIGLMVVILVAPFVAVRNTLWALPPAALLVTRVVTPSRFTETWRFGTVTLIGALGLAVGWADREYANLVRHNAQVTLRPLLQAQQPLTTYYSGQHGFAYYCSSVGMQPLDNRFTQLPPGTAVITFSPTAQELSPDLAGRLTEVVIVVRTGRWPFSTMSFGVSFYGTGTKDLPWVAGSAPEIHLGQFRARVQAATSGGN